MVVSAMPLYWLAFAGELTLLGLHVQCFPCSANVPASSADLYSDGHWKAQAGHCLGKAF